MASKPYRLLTVVLVLGWVFDFLFWRRPLGLNFVLFTTLCLLGGLALLLGNGQKPAWNSLLLILPFAFFGVMSVIRQEPLSQGLAFAFSLLSLGLLAATYLGGRWLQYSLLDYFKKAFSLLGSLIVLPFNYPDQVRQERAAKGLNGVKLPVKPIFRGLMLALPVVTTLSFLLASADLVFEQKLNQLLFKIESGQVVEYVYRLGIILLCAYVLTGIILYAASRSQDQQLLGENGPVIKHWLGFIETAVVLGSVLFLYLAFVTIQFRYFFGGQANIGEAGFTYSEYARRGFNELVAVAFLSLLLTLGLSTITRRETPFQQRVYSGLSVGVLALVLVILLSAYQRLTLAIDWHGFSRLRLYPRVFLIWVGILFAVVVVLEILHRERNFALAAVLASLGFAVSLCLVNVDASIVQYNVNRGAQGKNFNVNHLTSLSIDAVPALTQAFSDASLPKAVHEGTGAALLCFQRTPAIANARSQDWRSWSLSGQQASLALQSVETQFKGYQVNVEGSLVRVGTPSDAWYECAREPMEPD